MPITRKLAAAATIVGACFVLSVPAAHAGTIEVFSAEAQCNDSEQDPRQVVVNLAGEAPQEFDIVIDEFEMGTVAAQSAVGLSVSGDGPHSVVVKLKDTDQVVFETTVYLACEFPQIEYDGECRDDGGHLIVLIAQNQGYTFNVYVDDVPVAGFQQITDTDQNFADLGSYANGEYFVRITWYDGDQDIDDTGGNVTLDCEVDGGGSGAGIPDAGASTAPLLLIAGASLVLGTALLLGRRARHA